MVEGRLGRILIGTIVVFDEEEVLIFKNNFPAGRVVVVDDDVEEISIPENVAIPRVFSSSSNETDDVDDDGFE